MRGDGARLLVGIYIKLFRVLGIMKDIEQANQIALLSSILQYLFQHCENNVQKQLLPLLVAGLTEMFKGSVII